MEESPVIRRCRRLRVEGKGPWQNPRIRRCRLTRAWDRVLLVADKPLASEEAPYCAISETMTHVNRQP